MKKIFALLVIMVLSIGTMIPASAQNKIFEKYSDMDDVEYICITKSMLKLMSLGGSSVNINGVNVKGVTDAIKILLIINSEEQPVCQQMKTDFKTIKSDSNYELLMMIKNNKEKVYTLFNDCSKEKELVMYIDNEDSQTFIVMTGALTKEIVNSLMNNDN